ncbi:MAG TPA: hypothetical protein VE287_11465, partial [Actinopolymorphaceae bacterium]|nr:hypothetical protein [Actinopolymorphaceae bacterium]
TSDAASHLRVGLTFADTPGEVTWFEVGPTTAAGWNQHVVPLAAYVGRTIAAVSLGFGSDMAVADYAVNIGELRLRHRSADALRPPSAPRGFTIEQAHVVDDTATVFLAWQLAGPTVWYYDVFRVGAGAGREWLGRMYDEVYVVPGVQRHGEAQTSLELVAVSPAGIAGAPARASFSWT